MNHLGWVDANDLSLWANRIDAQNQMPKVLRRLISGSLPKPPHRMSFRAGEGVLIGGWDGFVETGEGNEFLPTGISVWETGTSRSVRAKADEDYEKRTKDPKGVDRLKTVFIFVTPRRWRDKHEWAEEKSREGQWAEVRAYDADDLEQWLELTPSVHTWLSRLLGKVPENLQDLDSFWQQWTQDTSPALTWELTLAGRNEVAEKTRSWLDGIPAVFTVRSDSRDEAIALLAAAIQQMPPLERDGCLSRCIVIRDRSSWDQIVAGTTGLTLIPAFPEISGIGSALERKHRIYVPLGREANASTETLEAPPLNRQDAEKALLEMGLPEELARQKVRQAGRSLIVLKRLLARVPEILQPVWANPENGPKLVPMLLIGAWDESKEADRRAVEEIARRPYEESVFVLKRWLNESDPPIRKVGSVWELTSREDSWHLLNRYISSDDLKAFERVALTFLGSEDPRFELAPDERWYAGVLGKQLPHSEHLRNGLLETLALLGARGPSNLSESVSAPERASLIVYKLLNEAGWKVWSSISQYLPLLAEAAPESFLDAVEKNLSGQEPPLLKLFEEEGFFGHSSHTGLLWALEGLAWNPDYLARVSLILAKLARLDPGGRLANRPDRSLREIFVAWRPQTMAPLERRIKVLDTLLAREPEVTWKLLCDLLPTDHETSSPTHQPLWRDWALDWKPVVTRRELSQSIEEIVERILANAATSVERWSVIVQRLNDLPATARTQAIDKLLSLQPENLNQSERLLLWNTLRKVIHTHRRFSDAAWALPEAEIERLWEAYQKLEPIDLVGRYAWLFTSNPELPQAVPDDFYEEERLVQIARAENFEEIFSNDGLTAILTLGLEVEHPFALGFTAGSSESPEDFEVLHATLGNAGRKLVRVGQGFIAGRLKIRGPQWSQAVMDSPEFQQWSAEMKADFLAYFEPSEEVFNWLAVAGPDVDALYWQRLTIFTVKEQYAEKVIGKFLDHGRALASLKLAGSFERKDQDQILPSELLLRILEKVADELNERKPEIQDWGTFEYCISNIFSSLTKRKDVDRSRLTKSEFYYLPLLKHGRYGPEVLLGELSRNPDFFADVLSSIFKAEDEEDKGSEEVSEEERARARGCHDLLNSWHQIPGLVADGKLEGEVLKQWLNRARDACYRRKRHLVGDHYIGQVLAHAPSGSDDAWPHEAVREVIEEIASRELERGIEIGVYNKRGAVCRAIEAGGEEERLISVRYEAYATMLADRWPRTAAMLRRIAASYKNDARREDIRVELRK